MTDPIESQRGALRALNLKLQRLEKQKQDVQNEINGVKDKIADKMTLLNKMYSDLNEGK